MTVKLPFNGVGIEVDIISPSNFLKIKETLTRIGVPKESEKKLFQSCHILHKHDVEGNSRYSIVHFKEMLKLDGKDVMYCANDIVRRNTIVKLLQEWKLVKIVNENDVVVILPNQTIRVLSFKEKVDWMLYTKYDIGKYKGFIK